MDDSETNVSVTETTDARYEACARAGSNDHVGVIAPHAEIEPGTGAQARHVHEQLSCPAWICRVHRKAGTSFSDAHITSTNISPREFSSIQMIFQPRPTRCVSLHGMSKDGIKIGGRAPRTLRNSLCDALTRTLPEHIEVIPVEYGPYCGKSHQNIVNRLSKGTNGGIQIEQSRHVRDTYGEVVAETLSGWLLDRVLPLSDDNSPYFKHRGKTNM